MISSARLRAALLLALSLAGMHGAQAQNTLDHRLPEDRAGIYRAQDAVPLALGLAMLSGALIEGSESRLGRSYWQGGESFLASGLLAEALKRVVRRESPATTTDPGHWFSADRDGSFPSAHVAITTAAVTPLILEYQRDQPWVWTLAALPAYEMVARVKAREHWQSDVLAGAALGASVGWYEHGRAKPWVLTLLPGGVFVGYHASLR